MTRDPVFGDLGARRGLARTLRSTGIVPSRMLIVDDEEALVFALSRYFAARGLEVDAALGIAEAEAFLGSRHYDLVLADLHLTSGPDGLELLSSVRRRSPDTRCVLLTGHVGIEGAAREAGVAAVVLKPCPLPALTAVVMGQLRVADPIPC